MFEAATGEGGGEEAAAVSADLERSEKVTSAAVRRLCKTAETDGLVVLVVPNLACCDTLYRRSRLPQVDVQRVETALVRSANNKVSFVSYCD